MSNPIYTNINTTTDSMGDEINIQDENEDIQMKHIGTDDITVVSVSNSTEPIVLENDNRGRPRWYYMFSGWSMEILGLAGALGIFAAITSLLFFYNGNSIEHTPSRPSLNTRISILSTILTSLVLGTTTAALGQSKWFRYTSPRPLSHLAHVDGATRGPSGAFVALFHPRLGFSAIAGAIIVLATLFIGPTTQETVGYRTLLRPDSSKNATAPVAQVYHGNGSHVTVGVETMNLPMKAAIMDGLLYPNSSNTALSFDCVTGNCTFLSPYTSLGICHSCNAPKVSTDCGPHNISGEIIYYCNYTLSSGHAIYGKDYAEPTVINVSSSYDAGGSTPLAHISIISLSNGPNCTGDTNSDCTLPAPSSIYAFEHQNVIGAQCTLDFCLKSYTANITNNLIEEQVVEIPSNFTQYGFESNTGYLYLLANPCFINGEPFNYDQYSRFNASNTNLELTTLQGWNETNIGEGLMNLTLPVDCVFNTDRDTQSEFISYFTSNTALFDGVGIAEYGMQLGGYIFDSSSIGVEALFNHGNASFESLDTAFEYLATSMTNIIRQSGTKSNTTTAPGVLLQTQTAVTVRWLWLIAPVGIYLCSCVYLGIMMFQSIAITGTHVEKGWKWKNDPVALLLLRASSRSIESEEPLLFEKVRNKICKDVKVQLVKVDRGWEFSEQSTGREEE